MVKLVNFKKLRDKVKKKEPTAIEKVKKKTIKLINKKLLLKKKKNLVPKL